MPKQKKLTRCPYFDGTLPHDENPYHVHNEPYCGKQGNMLASGYGHFLICTRPVGHTGNHIACGGTTHNLHVWE